MSIKFLEGFSSYSAPSQMLSKWSNTSVLNGSQFVPGRIPSLGNSLAFNGSSLLTYSLGANSTWIIGFYFQNIDLVFSLHEYLDFFQLLDNTTAQIYLRYDGDTNKIMLRSGSTTLATSTNALVQGVWYHIELKVVVSDIAGSAELRINERQEFIINGVNTRQSLVNQADRIKFIGTGSGTFTEKYRLDDLVVLDGSNNLNNNFLGKMYIETLRTTDNGVYSQWTPTGGYDNYQAALSKDDAIVNQTSTSGQIDLYKYSTLQKVKSDIRGIQINNYGRNENGTNHVVQNSLLVGGSLYNGSNLTVDSTANKTYNLIMEKNPDTNAQWTANDIDTAQIGIKLV